ncbi:tRNA (adenosine(37)-N6)-threonylcarbamoyltransferase complex ATPase subunit type 1 TsaE [Paramicrobacterium fandaimingii]|uniref:tRNA (adenosine(37)-N6)-threonylcarbamoyltransferase complex ATPase subunit type 1 TsaE n=1 Tax=Paramicrobacterium fandaimingii TaxID=2708079 RepID=UPI00141F6889
MIEVPSTIVCETPDDMHELGLEVGRMLHAGDLLVLTGPLGAGKTTLTRGIGEGLGVRGPITSPTFVLARTHPNLAGGAPLVHVDAYRLSDARELDDLDIDFERSVVVVEWGRGMLAGIAPSWLEIEIERPTGATAAALTDVVESDTPKTVADSTSDGDRTWHLTSADADADADADEPRVVRIARVAE